MKPKSKSLLFAATVMVACSVASSAQALSDQGNAKLSAAVVEGDAHLAEGDFAQAIESYQQALKENDRDSIAHQRLGHALSLNGDLQGAVAEERKALEVDSNNAQAHCDIGYIFGLQQRFRAAIEEEKLAITLDENNPSAYSILGLSLASIGDYDLAISALNKAIALDQTDANLYMNLAAAYGRKKEYKSAGTMYKHAVELNPSSPNAYLGLGAALGKTGDLNGQMKAYEQAVALAPNNPENHGRLGFALSQIGDWRAALREGSVANGLRMKRSANDFFKMFLTTWAAIFVVFGLVFAIIFSGSKFKAQPGETLIKSFFLVFYKDKPGRFVLTSRRIVFVPEAFSTWFGSTRLSIELDQVGEVESHSTVSGGRLSILSANGTVYQFSMPNLVLEPLTKQLKDLAETQSVPTETILDENLQVSKPASSAVPQDTDADTPYDPFFDEKNEADKEAVIVEVVSHQSSDTNTANSN